VKIADLGTFTKPVLICGGAYGNLQALAALADLQSALGISDSQSFTAAMQLPIARTPKLRCNSLQRTGGTPSGAMSKNRLYWVRLIAAAGMKKAPPAMQHLCAGMPMLWQQCLQAAGSGWSSCPRN
jgi:hypothetical protein